MSKKILFLIVILMSVSLVGIIVIQVKWIETSIRTSNKQFSSDISSVLSKVSGRIEKEEAEGFVKAYGDMVSSEQSESLNSSVAKFVYTDYNSNTNEKIVYSNTVFEKNYKMPSNFFESDSVIYTETTNKKELYVSGKQRELLDAKARKDKGLERTLFDITKTSSVALKSMDGYYKLKYANIPIHKRIGSHELKLLLSSELKKRNMDIDFRYAVVSKGIVTSIKSTYYKSDKYTNYKATLFEDYKGEAIYELHINFPDRNNYLLSSISTILLFSIIFIVIIVLTFSGTLYLLLKQKKISEVKTDFINNMTHEFKTPIATINLALDAIKNPIISDNKDKLGFYSNIIRAENKRMLSQVENVLRISQLERGQLSIDLDEVDMDILIDVAISHVELLNREKGGKIVFNSSASVSNVLGDEFHLVNSITNLLENAIKYCETSPFIEINTYNCSNFFTFTVKDNAIGMSKSVQKNIFDRFYRAEGGNIHNVKGHGLGLSYVRNIVELHKGIIFVNSEKSEGSTFTVKIPFNRK